MIVLDTNVLSELMRPHPDDNVSRWIAARPAQSLFVTSVSEAEIRYGLMSLPEGKRRDALTLVAEAMFREDFAGRILSFGSDATEPYAVIASERRAAGRPISPLDVQIAAIVRCYRATLVTRNVADFEGCGIAVVDPWAA